MPYAPRKRTPVAAGLPVFPWDTLAEVRDLAARHPDGIVDLSVGTPVDNVDPFIQSALEEAAEVPGYPQTIGTEDLRQACAHALTRRYGTIDLDPATQVLPVIGTKELIAWLPTLLGLGENHTVVIPEIAYPTYEVGALLAGCSVVRADGTAQVGPLAPTLMYLNTPSNPTGKVLPVEHLRKIVDWARERGVIIASDECYLGLCWEGTAPSILDPEVCGGDTRNLLAIHSLSKTSNMASYRSGFVVGDPELVGELLAVRKHAGLMMPTVVQHASAAALRDDRHAGEQYDRYRHRRDMLKAALESAGMQIDESAAGLYLWTTNGTPCRELTHWFAERGILVAPGEFYGPRGSEHVRIALTATDERIAAACDRLRAETV